MRPQLSPGLAPRPASQSLPASVGAISWALNPAPVPADHGGRHRARASSYVSARPSCRAGRRRGIPAGDCAGPCTGLSERTVRTYLDRLEAVGSIAPCDPDLVAARIERADHCPQDRDLDLTLVRGDLSELGATVPASPPPARRARLAATGQALLGVQAGPGRGRPSRTSSVREVMPSLVKTFRRW